MSSLSVHSSSGLLKKDANSSTRRRSPARNSLNSTSDLPRGQADIVPSSLLYDPISYLPHTTDNDELAEVNMTHDNTLPAPALSLIDPNNYAGSDPSRPLRNHNIMTVHAPPTSSGPPIDQSKLQNCLKQQYPGNLGIRKLLFPSQYAFSSADVRTLQNEDCRNICSVEVNDARHLTTADVVDILRCMGRHLTVLALDNAAQVGDEVFRGIVEYGGALEYLRLTGAKVTDAGLLNLCDNVAVGNLREVVLYNTPLITENAARKLTLAKEGLVAQIGTLETTGSIVSIGAPNTKGDAKIWFGGRLRVTRTIEMGELKDVEVPENMSWANKRHGEEEELEDADVPEELKIFVNARFSGQ